VYHITKEKHGIIGTKCPESISVHDNYFTPKYSEIQTHESNHSIAYTA